MKIGIFRCMRSALALTVLPLIFFVVYCASTVSAAQVELLHEDFESWPPPGWAIINNGGDCVWVSNAASGRVNYAGGDGNCAGADSDWCFVGTTMNTELWSPVLDLSDASVASLSYVAAYNDIDSADYARVRVSGNNGATWSTVLYWDSDHSAYGPGETVTIDLTPWVGSDQVMISFHYNAPEWDWWYQVDQVEVVAYQGTEFEGEWQVGSDSDFQFTRFDGEYYPGDKKVYFMGGRLWDGSTDGSVWSFDPATGVYADTGVDLVIPISNYKMNLLQDGDGNWGFYVFCGRTGAGGQTTTVQVYYPDSNSVALLPFVDDYPGELTCTSALNVVHNNRAYVAGGFQPIGPPYHPAQTHYFDPTIAVGSKWTYLTGFPTPRAYVMGAVVDELIYAIGGSVSDGVLLNDTSRVQVLDPNAPTPVWEDASVADLPMPCSSSRAFGFGSKSSYRDAGGSSFAGKIVTGCGRWSNENDKVFVYDTKSDEWGLFPSLQMDRRDQAAVFLPPESLPNDAMSGMCLWGGRQDEDFNVLTTPEYYPVSRYSPWILFLPAIVGDKP